MRNLTTKEQEIARTFGTNLCGALIQVEARNIDPLYREKRENGVVVPSKPFRLLTVKKTAITSVGVVETANGIRLEINGNENFRFKFDESIASASVENITEAVRRFDDKQPPVLFVDYAGVLKQLKAVNRETISEMDSFANDIMTQMQTLSGVMSADEQDLANTFGINI